MKLGGPWHVKDCKPLLYESGLFLLTKTTTIQTNKQTKKLLLEIKTLK